MQKVVALAMGLVVLALAVGCATHGADAPRNPAPQTHRAIPAGSPVTLKNGLTLTVPASWTATLTTYPSPSEPLQAIEFLELDNWANETGPKSLMVISSAASTMSLSALGDFGKDTFKPAASVGGLDVVAGRPDRGFAPKRLMAVQTHIPASSLGIIFFAGDPKDPAASLHLVWQLFDVKGLELP